MSRPWGLLALLVAAMCISFFDRGNLAVAAPFVSSELGLSQWSMGVLLSAFFWTYSVSQIASGWLVDRVEVRWVYAGGFFLWTLATLLTGFASSFTALLLLRLLLGLGESVTYPATSRVLAATFPETRRGLANSLIDLGPRLGPALGTALGALLVRELGWRGLFFATGAAGLLWLLPWVILAPPKLVAATPAQRAIAPGWKDLLRLSWLPSYLMRERGFSLKSVAFWGALPFLVMAVSSLGGGVLADRWIARGGSPVRVRKTFLVTGLLLTAALIPSVLAPRLEWAVAGLLATCFAFGIYASNLFSLTQTLAGPAAAGRWTGFQNACGNLAGIVSPMVAGWIVDTTGSFAWAFIAAGLACIAGASSFWFLVRKTDSASL